MSLESFFFDLLSFFNNLQTMHIVYLLQKRCYSRLKCVWIREANKLSLRCKHILSALETCVSLHSVKSHMYATRIWETLRFTHSHFSFDCLLFMKHMYARIIERERDKIWMKWVGWEVMYQLYKLTSYYSFLLVSFCSTIDGFIYK